MPPAANIWAPTIAASNARRVQRFGLSRGVEPARIGLAGELPSERVPARRMFELWSQLVAALDPAAPIQVAEASSLEDLQLLGFTLITAPTVRDGLEAFMRFSPLLSDAFAWRLGGDGRALEIRWQVRVARDPGVCASLETSIAQVVKGIRQLAGDDVDPLRVSFGHAAPRRLAAHRAFFRCPIEFEAGAGPGAYRVLFPRHVLEAVPRQANAALWSYLCAQADRSVATLGPQPLAARVRGEIADSLAAGNVPRLGDLADRLGTSERSLRRQLAADAISFRKLLDDQRRERAQELLSAPDASVTRIALDLGFADSSALTHACQRWFACPPGELKRKAH
jgi:AraC-like DNA-binding protein